MFNLKLKHLDWSKPIFISYNNRIKMDLETALRIVEENKDEVRRIKKRNHHREYMRTYYERNKERINAQRNARRKEQRKSKTEEKSS